MQVEFDLESFKPEESKDSILEEVVFKTLQTLIIRAKDPKTRTKPLSLLMSIKAYIFAFECEHFGCSVNPADYTPRRANDLMICEINQEKAVCLTPRKIMLDYILNGFWISCCCARNCFTKVSVASAIQTHEYYSGLDSEEKSKSLGALVKNMDRNFGDQRGNQEKKSYRWQINGSEICKSFFLFIHVSKKELQRIQEYHENDVDFGPKRKGNNKLKFSLMRIFISL